METGIEHRQDTLLHTDRISALFADVVTSVVSESVSTEHWLTDTDKRNPKYYEKTSPKNTSSTINSTRIFLRWNQYFHGEIFSHGTALPPSCMQTHTGYINNVSDTCGWHVSTTRKRFFFEPMTFDRRFTLSWVTLNVHKAQEAQWIPENEGETSHRNIADHLPCDAASHTPIHS
jgi:hypothetical protein